LEPLIGERECFCLPHRYLRSFYGRIGFVEMAASEAPAFLQARCAEYRRVYGLDVVIMRRPKPGGNGMTDLESLRTTVEAFCRFVEGLPADALAEQEWGPKEVLAHLVSYHELYVAQVEALLAGAPIEPPQGRYSDLNAQAVARSRDVPPAELVARFRAANHRLCALAAAPQAQALVLEIKKGVKPRRLDSLIPEIEAHVRNHLQQLAKSQRATA
jgi:hypothetical protein